MRSEQGEEERILALTIEQKRLQTALANVQDELKHLYIAKKKSINPAPLTTTYPLGRKVRITNQRDPGNLYQTVAVVSGHTKARVKICVDGTEYLRAGSSLKLLKGE